MADIRVPVFRINGTNAFVVFLYIVAVFGALHLLAISAPNNRLAQAWLGLNF